MIINWGVISIEVGIEKPGSDCKYRRERTRTENGENLTLSSQGGWVETSKGVGEEATTSELEEDQDNGVLEPNVDVNDFKIHSLK